MTLIKVLIFTLYAFYIGQLVAVWLMFFMDNVFKTKKEFLCWHIPLFPFISIIMERFKELK